MAHAIPLGCILQLILAWLPCTDMEVAIAVGQVAPNANMLSCMAVLSALVLGAIQAVGDLQLAMRPGATAWRRALCEAHLAARAKVQAVGAGGGGKGARH